MAVVSLAKFERDPALHRRGGFHCYQECTTSDLKWRRQQSSRKIRKEDGVVPGEAAADHCITGEAIVGVAVSQNCRDSCRLFAKP
ncbi:hypothetical protein E2562_006443 [Oryza meyeriana var. granulata]|uniref:Uncharacterized protein n=1 Tax=Oryza meyeriana var. granulata TaxID=110450 RepID=A0A6G1CNV8_9ORYZ|nr:hypothetical protein E2562_006443 [Oryza meyeriana var. granulata]